MWRQLVLSAIIGLLTSVGAGSQTVYDLIRSGRLQEARDSLSQHASAAVRDGNTLFYQSLLESSGAASARLMEAALDATLPSRHREEITYRLAQYYLLRKDYRRLTELLTDYFSRWEKGSYRPEMLRLSVLADEQTKAYETALRQCDRYLVENSSGDPQQWGLIDKARVLDTHGKQIGAAETIKQLSHSRKGIGVPQALYLLGMQAVAGSRADDAIFYYNLLKERYPVAVGLDQLTAGLGEMSDRPRTDNQAEKVTGTFYAVKVGVFSDVENARRYADKFKSYDKKVDVAIKAISGRDYRVVYVGRFQNYDEAVRFRLRLEADFKETFQVVAR